MSSFYRPLLLLLFVFAAISNPVVADVQQFSLQAGEFSFDEVRPDSHLIRMDGFSNTGSPGSPALPRRVFLVAIPPDTVPGSLRLELVRAAQTEIPGQYDIAPRPPAVTRVDGRDIFLWGDATNIVDGKDMDIYGSDHSYPAQPVELLRSGQMRKYRYAKVKFTPISFNPVSGMLNIAREVSLVLHYERDASLLDEALLSDCVFDHKARSKFLNYHEARKWYEPRGVGGLRPLDDSSVCVIITSDAVVGGSQELATYIAHLESLQYDILVLTETTPGGGYGAYDDTNTPPPHGTAEKIRQWLIDHYTARSIQFVLLIGDPNPSTGDVPMKMCWPRRNAPTDPGYDRSPTDYYYSDLTGDWDINGNGYYGEFYGDNEDGGVDFDPEVYVGRIPVYNDDYATLDGILEKIIAYETASGDLSWRKDVLLPMGFVIDFIDGSYVGHYMKQNYLQDRGFGDWEMYQRKGDGCYSAFDPDERLQSGKVKDRWSANPFGIVFWLGHGSSTYTAIGYSSGSYSCSEGTLFSTSYCSDLDDSKPAFAYQGSCLNGYPESSGNLGYALLKRGAIGTVSASRVSWADDWNFYPSDSGCLQNIGYHYFRLLTDYANYSAGEALYDAKGETAPDEDWYWMNLMDFNLYGAPQTKLLGSGNTYIELDEFTASARLGSISLDWRTGVEIETAGFIIYRKSGAGKDFYAVSGLIEPKGGPANGASYHFVDRKIGAGTRYYYYLVEIDVAGATTAFGPVSALAMPDISLLPLNSSRGLSNPSAPNAHLR